MASGNNGDSLKIGWKYHEQLCKKLSTKIDFDPDYILCINSGGLLVGKLLSEYKKKPLLVISAKSYTKRERGPLEIEEFSALEKVKGKVLLVDDLADSGKTLLGVSEKLKTFKAITQLKTATLIVKPISLFKPDYFVVEDSRWIIFPYEGG